MSKPYTLKSVIWLAAVTVAAVASFNKAVPGGGYGPLVTSGQILSGVQGKAGYRPAYPGSGSVDHLQSRQLGTAPATLL